jgi:HAD superfamily hydrolase (TIGR01458 family)
MPLGILCDVHGVLYVYPQAIPQSVLAVERLKSSGIPFCFLTNSTQFPKRHILQDLQGAGFDLSSEHLLTSPQAAANVLRSQGIQQLGWMCSEELKEDFTGFHFANPDQANESVEAVVVGDLGQGFSYPVLNQAFRWIQEGAKLVALARNRFYQSKQGLVLDCGPFVKLLEEATGTEALVTGKPSPAFFQSGLEQVGTSPENTVMIGDDLDFDVLPAMEMGLRGILVATGKFRPDVYERSAEKPHVLAKNLYAALDELLP